MLNSKSFATEGAERFDVPDVASVPLCVDLDGTLIRSDVMIEGLVASAWGWRRRLRALWSLTNGRASLKQNVAELGGLDPALLPYNESLINHLRAQKEAGRKLVLATAADMKIAHAIAAHIGVFDEVIASDGTTNLKGEFKARRLVERFGERGFAYAANSRSDLPVWRSAASAVVVNASPGVVRAAKSIAPSTLVIGGRGSLVASLLRAIRPHQWVKNLLCFVPIITAHAYGDSTAWIGGALIFAAFCSTASGVYLVNDLSDLAADRAHSRKRRRPFASGSAPIAAGLVLAPLLLLLGCALGYAANAMLVVIAYAATSLLYSAKLKELPLVNVFCLAALYTLRLVAGGKATGHALSLWLLAFSGFVFLSLAFLKRTEELTAAPNVDRGLLLRRGYSSGDAATLQVFGCGSAFAASVVLALFVQNEATAERYASPGLLWGTVPLVLFWQCRLWLSTSRGYMHDDPIIYAARDWVSWIVGGTLVVLIVLAKSVSIADW